MALYLIVDLQDVPPLNAETVTKVTLVDAASPAAACDQAAQLRGFTTPHVWFAGLTADFVRYRTTPLISSTTVPF